MIWPRKELDAPALHAERGPVGRSQRWRLFGARPESPCMILQRDTFMRSLTLTLCGSQVGDNLRDRTFEVKLRISHRDYRRPFR